MKFNEFTNSNLFLFLSTILILAAVTFNTANIKNLEYDANAKNGFDRNAEFIQEFNALEETYGTQDTVIIYFEPAAKTPTDIVQSIKNIHEQAELMPSVIKAESIANHMFFKAVEGEVFSGTLLDYFDQYPSDNSIHNYVFEKNGVVKYLVSEDKNLYAIFVTVDITGDRDNKVNELTKSTYLIEENNSDLGRFYFGGSVVAEKEISSFAQSDTEKIFGLLVLAMCFVLLLLTLSFGELFAITITAGMASAAAVGFAASLGLPMQPLSSPAPSVIFVLVIAQCVHVTSSIRSGFKADQMSKLEAVCYGRNTNLAPIFLCTLTSSLGFALLNFSDSPPMRNYGTMVSIGLVFGFLLSMTFIPLFARFLFKVRAAKDCGEGKINKNVKNIFRNSFMRKPGLISVIALIVIAGSIPASKMNIISDYSPEFIPESVRFRSDNTFVSDQIGGLTSLSFSFSAKDGESIVSPEYINFLSSFSDWLRSHENVLSVSSYSDVIHDIDEALQMGDVDDYTDHLFLMGMSSQPGVYLTEMISHDESATKLTVTLSDGHGHKIEEFRGDVKTWFVTNNFQDRYQSGTGLEALYTSVAHDVFRVSVSGGLVNIFFVTIILFFLLRNITETGVATLANLAPILIAFGIWGVLSGRVGVGLAPAVTTILGIVVDDTIHFITHYSRSRKNRDVVESCQYAMEKMFRPITTSTLVIVTGYVVASFSEFQTLKENGIFVVISVSLACLFDILILPAMLMLANKKTAKINTEVNHAVGRR